MNREEARKRAKELVAKMTVEEKASQLRYDAPAIDRLGIPAYNWWYEDVEHEPESVEPRCCKAHVSAVAPEAQGRLHRLLSLAWSRKRWNGQLERTFHQ